MSPDDGVLEDVLYYLKARLVGFLDEHLVAILAGTLGGRAIFLVGCHGLGKTRLCELMARIHRGTFRKYDCAVDDITIVAGIPDASALSRGELKFARHSRSAHDAEILFLDELSRLPRGGDGSLFLELVDTRSLFGEKLDKLKVIFSAANPATSNYRGTTPVDDGQLDRFDLLINLPTPSDLTKGELARVAKINLAPPSDDFDVPHIDELREAFAIRRDQLVRDAELVDTVSAWCAELVSAVRHDSNKEDGDAHPYISLRAIARCVAVVIDFLTVDCLNGRLVQNLVERCELAGRLSLMMKCHIGEETFENGLLGARQILRAYQNAHEYDFDRLHDLTVGSIEKRIASLEALDVAGLSPGDTFRLETMLNQMTTEVFDSDSDLPNLPSRLWQAIPGIFRETRHAVELKVFRDRVDHVITSDAKSFENLEPVVANDNCWTPDSPQWMSNHDGAS